MKMGVILWENFIEREDLEMLKCLLLFLTAVVMVGCASKQARYVDSGTVVTGTADKVTMYELESSAQMLMQKMLVHPQFVANYNAVKAEKGQLPIVVIGNIDSKIKGVHIQGRLDAVGESLRVALFNSALFDVKDDEAADAIKSRIVRSADGGLETGELFQLMGTHNSPDFIVLGDLRHFKDVGGYHTYRLRLALHSLRTGKILWEGIQTKVKL